MHNASKQPVTKTGTIPNAIKTIGFYQNDREEEVSE
jgi:hypothetical protein